MWQSAVLALRNLSRHPRRTALTALMISSGTVLIVFVAGLAEGSYAQMIELSTGLYTGHFQVLGTGYHEKPSLFVTIKNTAAWEAKLRAHPDIAAVSSRVESAGLVSAGTRTRGVALLGVEKCGVRRHPGVVHQDIQAAHALDALAHQPLPRRSVYDFPELHGDRRDQDR